MRITHDILLNIARDTVARRARGDRGLIAAYLCGSLLGNDYLFGGAADIDLVFIHDDEVPVEREIVSLTAEVHLDIAHHHEREYHQARQLRHHPWLGPSINACKALYDPRHFMDFTQASVRSQFGRSDHVFARARRHAEMARTIWLSQHNAPPEPGPAGVLEYLRAISHAANAIASLQGPPLTERRFLLTFPSRAEALGKAGLHAGLLGLLGYIDLPPGTLAAWLPEWQAAYQSIPIDQAPPRLHPDRRLYYQKALDAMLNSPTPEATLWPMLRTWTAAACLLPPAAVETWKKVVVFLGLTGEAFSGRLEALDAYLDLIDETLEEWARLNGAWES